MISLLVILLAVQARSMSEVINVTEFSAIDSPTRCRTDRCEWFDGMTLADIATCISSVRHPDCQYHLQYLVNVRMDLSALRCGKLFDTVQRLRSAASKRRAHRDESVVYSANEAPWGTGFAITKVLFLNDLIHWASSPRDSYKITDGTLRFVLRIPVPSQCPIIMEYALYECGPSLRRSPVIAAKIAQGEVEWTLRASELDVGHSYASVTFRDRRACYILNAIDSVDLVNVVVEAYLHTVS